MMMTQPQTTCDKKTPCRRAFMAGLLIGIAGCATLPASGADIPRKMQDSVVKIFVTQQREDYTTPWQSAGQAQGSGSGFVIGKRRILTNAHVVSNARFIQVRKPGDSRLYPARVAVAGHDCDLAIVSVDDPHFFDTLPAVEFAREMPSIDDEVIVLGYPMGGDYLSVTRGVVSRLDYALYTHSGVDMHFVLQVDAAINPGNSGGPVFYHKRVVGLAFQGMMMADNIGYAIPLPVIQHFLDDIKDDRYNGYPEVGITELDNRNPALRRHLNLPAGSSGVIVCNIDPFGSALGHLQPGDLLMAVDGYPISEDGAIQMDGHTINYSEIVERKQWGESVVFDIWRGGTNQTVTVPLRNPADPFLYRSLYDARPRYLTLGGLVFSPLNREYLRAMERNRRTDVNASLLFYYAGFAKPDGWYKDRDEFVVLIRRLPHDINTYVNSYLNGVVDTVNGIRIRNLAHLRTTLDAVKEDFYVIRFIGLDEPLIMEKAAVDRAAGEILSAYGVAEPEYLGPEAPK